MELRDIVTWLIGGLGAIIVYCQYRTTSQYAKENLQLQHRLEHYSNFAQIELKLEVAGTQVCVIIANLSPTHSIASYQLRLSLDCYAASGAVRVVREQLELTGGVLGPSQMEKVRSEELNRYLSYAFTVLKDEPSERDRLIVRAHAACTPPQKGAGKIYSNTTARLIVESGILQIQEQAEYFG